MSDRGPDAAVCRIPITVSAADVRMMHAIDRFIIGHRGDNLLHDTELTFPGASYRAFYLAYERTQDPARWLEPEGTA
jgi:hypothetical protein